MNVTLVSYQKVVRHLKCKIYKLKNEQKQSHKVITSLNCNRNTENCDFMNHNTVSTYIIICIFFLKKKKEKKSLPTYPPLLSMGRPTANKDIFKSGLTSK